MLAVVAAAILIGGLSIRGISDGSPTPPPTVTPAASIVLGGHGQGYLVTADELRKRAGLAERGIEPYASAVAGLLAEADRAMGRVPRPQQPLTINGTGGPFVEDSADAYTLSLAYVVGGQRRYAVQAGRILDAWAATVSSTRGTCADSGACQTSLVISRMAPALVFAADLIRPAVTFDDPRFRSWLRDVILPAASQRTNNWGDAGTFMRLVVTDYLGDDQRFKEAVAFWRSQMDLVAADGHIPEETRRGSSGMLYSQGALSFKAAAALIAERRGVSLWEYRGAGGATLHDAIDYLASYWSRPKDWPWHHGMVDLPTVDPFWELAYARWPSRSYARIVTEGRPFSASGDSAVRWTTLTNGVPIAEGDR